MFRKNINWREEHEDDIELYFERLINYDDEWYIGSNATECEIEFLEDPEDYTSHVLISILFDDHSKYQVGQVFTIYEFLRLIMEADLYADLEN